ncbi:MAG TPA: hypothetical protein VHH90_10695 [Polyangia bacterium]|nr:hypothetical protein [Polyangia bacterium]
MAWREARGTAVAALAALAGCSTVPPPIVAPASRAARTAALTWSIDYGYAHAHIQRPDGSIQAISGNGDSTWGNPDPEATELTLPMPAAASLHQVTGDWDTGEYAGWRRFGVTARVRLITAAGGAATSIASAMNAHWSLRGVDASLAVEQTLPVARVLTLLGRIGVSYGLRDYDVQVPSDLDASAHHDNTIGAAHFDLLRPDLRLEPVLGVVIGEGSSLILSVQPYFVLRHGAVASPRCADCVADVRLVDFTENAGLAVALTFHPN